MLNSVRRWGFKWARTMAPAVALAIAACSSGSSGGSSVSADQACSDTANAVCQRLASCSAFLIQDTYGDSATCATRVKASCTNELAANGTGLTPALRETCVAAVGSASCTDLLDNNFPVACQPPAGTLATGAPCGASSQCQSTYCNVGTDGSCGACAAARGAAGAACHRDDDCDYGSFCSTNVCVTPVASGGTCDASHPCQKALACKSGICGAPDEAGATCTANSCDSLAGLYCTTVTTALCTKVALSTAGQPCGEVSGTFTVCQGGGHCTGETLTAPGTCEAPAADGAACDDTKGPTCLQPAVCGATSKVCTIPDPATCH